MTAKNGRACLSMMVACAVLAAASAAYDVEIVATGFTWAENLRCDAATQSLFVSEYRRGELYKITYDDGFNATVHVSSGFDIFAGLAIYEKTNELFAIAQDTDGDCWIVQVDTVAAETTRKVAKLPKLGNGLAIDQRNGNLYATAEGDFVPFEGAVYEIVPATGNVTTIMSGSFADDGAYINQKESVLIISEVIDSEVVQIDVDTNGQLQEHRAPSNVGMLDDFCLSANGTLLYGADYEHGNLVEFRLDGKQGSNAAVLVSNLKNPTSARWGCGGGFPETSLFVTEGNTLFGKTANRMVLEVKNVRQASQA